MTEADKKTMNSLSSRVQSTSHLLDFDKIDVEGIDLYDYVKRSIHLIIDSRFLYKTNSRIIRKKDSPI